MGHLVSLATPATEDPPCHIGPAPHPLAVSLDSPPASPPLPFFTAPSTPLTSPQHEDPPADPAMHHLPAPPSPPLTTTRLQASCAIETLPAVDALLVPDLAVDLALDDDGLSTLEKIYLFSRSRSAHHRVFISHALPSLLANVTPLEAAEYVLPLLPSLAMDEDESVKEALASELFEILWWFLTHCLLVEDPPDPGVMPVSRQRDGNDVTLLSVQAFTPILGTLLLSPNGMVSGPARSTVVDVLGRIRNADLPEQPAPTDLGLFGRSQRQMFQEELVHQLVIGIGRLDASADDEDVSEIWYDATARTPASELPETRLGASSPLDGDQASVNPYFPHPAPTVATTTDGCLTVPPFQLTPDIPRGDPRKADRTLPSEGTYVRKLHMHADAHLPNGLPQPDHRSPRKEGGEADQDIDSGDQAAMGRLSSMSLIAAVAAGGTLRLDDQRAFVREVERAGKDPVHWVRREASFALGALAKVIPEEWVVSALLPLFETLRQDTIWHVRHSSLFALPAVLSRLTPALRHAIALSTVVPLTRDESPTVRSGVLEALGEVLYTFHADGPGPPNELLSLFLGRHDHTIIQNLVSSHPTPHSFAPKLDLFFDDPVRPLACAFNYPAVALTLGRPRWGELRSLYLSLSQNRSVKVRKTLAASLGELAMIIGPENARRDLVDVWWDAMQCTEDGDIRLKAIEALPLFVHALEGEARAIVFSGLVKIWIEGWLRSWRAREGIIKIIPNLVDAPTYPKCIHRLLKSGLDDDFGAVREASISVVTYIQGENGTWKTVLDLLRHDILELAYAASSRKRMTYVACQQALLVASLEADAYLADENNWKAFERLSSDSIVGVRIGIARLVGRLCDKYAQSPARVPPSVAALVDRLRADCSAEVRSYVPVDRPVYSDRSGPSEIFSRPPPTTTLGALSVP